MIEMTAIHIHLLEPHELQLGITSYKLVKSLPKHQRSGSIQMALAATDLDHLHAPLLDGVRCHLVLVLHVVAFH